MKRSFRVCVRLAAVWAIVVFSGRGLAWADDAASDEEQGIVRLTIHPAKEPRPALKYRLTVGLRDCLPGNAAVHYGNVKAEQNHVFGNSKTWDLHEKWRAAPLAELRSDKVRDQWHFSWIFDSLDRGARCGYCDWQTPILEGNYYALPIPHVQESRSFARLLEVRARIQVARGEYDEAVRTLRNGYALGRHLAAHETIISGLVGVSICEVMSNQVETFVQQSDAPNLYWALTALPRPVVDMRPGLDGELDALWLSIPDLHDVEKDSGDAGYWGEKARRVWQLAMPLGNASLRPGMMPLAAMRSYPLAKRDLIERGYSPERIEAMPVGRVLLLHLAVLDQEARDHLIKESFLPYSVADSRLDRVEGDLPGALGGESVYAHQFVPLTSWLVPALGAASAAGVRIDRQVAALRVVEALRLHAASHGGRLPVRLDDVTEVPIPPDPSTGKPFFYQRSGREAVLMSPALNGRPLQYKIRMAK